MSVPATLTGTRANLPFLKQAPDFAACNVTTSRKCVKECLGSDVDLRVLTTARARQIMGAPPGFGSSIDQTEKLFQHYGMVKGVDYVRINYKPWATARDLLAAGWGVTLFVNYKYINDMLSRFSGSPDFNGPHAVYCRYRWRQAKWRLGLHDPLHDARRRAIPQGSVNAPQWLIRGATEAYAINNAGEMYAGRAVGYAVKRRTA